MPRLIIKNGYLKNSAKSSSHKSYLVNYIATRDGVEYIKSENKSATENQKKLVEEIIKEFPVSKLSFEYEDYKNNPTAENASDFISVSLEQHLDKIGNRQKYLDYIANRPRVEKISTHGLFNGTDNDIVLSKVAKEISEHTGNVWTPIISLHREDAHITGYENAHEWQALISEKMIKIAESLKIHPDNFRWYGAFHNESHHPHVHLICYSIDPNEGYLTKQGIEKMKSALQTEIFKAELAPLYAKKTEYRDELKKEVSKSFVELKSKLQNTDYSNPQLENLILQLSQKLKTHKGKKQFGYLQPHTKNIVNAIVDQLANEPNIKSAYDLWQELQEEIYYGYKDTLPPRLKLSEQKEFKLIKNMIIREVLNLEHTNLIKELDTTTTPEEKAKVIDEITELAEDGNVTAQYQLGKLYFFGKDVVQNKETAIKWLNLSAEQGNEYAKSFLENMDKWNNPYVGFTVTNLLKSLSNVFEDNKPMDSTTTHQKIDSKSMRKLREIKASKGIKHTGEDLENTYQQTM